MGIRVGIIGAAGVVGSAVAFKLAEQGFVSEVIMLDAREDMVRSHAMDIAQAAASIGDAAVRVGAWSDLEGCNVVIMAASVPVQRFSIDDIIASNIGLLREVASQVAKHCPKAVVMCASNPVDVFNYGLYKLSGLEAKQFLGYSWNDTLRFRYALAEVLRVSVTEIEAVVLGEHGELKVPLFDRIRLRSQPVQLTIEQENEVIQGMRGWFSSFLRCSGSARTAGWTCAVGMSRLVGAIATESDEVLPCSAILKGEYAFSGISMGVPVRLNTGGVREIVELPLTSVQGDALKGAATKIQDSTSRLLSFPERER